jgi:hypothetical protein
LWPAHLASPLDDRSVSDDDLGRSNVADYVPGRADLNGLGSADRPAHPAQDHYVSADHHQVQARGGFDLDVPAGRQGFAGVGADDTEILQRDGTMAMRAGD